MKIGIAFAGGGVRGAAHLGVLQALEEQGIQADLYAGTSAGSIIAIMKALGYSNADCLEVIESASDKLIDVAYWDIIKSMPSKFKTLDSVLKGEKLKGFFSEHIGNSLLLHVKHGLGVISTDINTGAQIIFTSETLGKQNLAKIDDHVTACGRYTPLPLAHIAYSSCALPGIFRPLEYNNMKLVDGSVTNNLPANVLKTMGADKVIAIDLAKRNPKSNKTEGIFDIVGQSVSILIGQNSFLSTSQTENVIRLNPNITGIGLLEFNKTRECYEAGYRYGKKVAKLVKKALES